MKHKVKITETLERVVEVEASNRSEAIEIVRDMVNREEIVLYADDFTGREYHALSSI